MIRLCILTTLCISMMMGCKPSSNPSNNTPLLILESGIVADSIGKFDPSLGTPSMRCKVVYLMAKGGAPGMAAAVSDTLSALAIQTVQGLQFGDSVPPVSTLAAAVQAFRRQYEREVADYDPKNPDGLPPIHQCEVSMTEGYRNEKVLCVTQDGYFFMGGAHPNTYKTHVVFDIKTGKTLAWKDIVKNETALLGLIEKALRRLHKVPDNYSLKEAGVLFDDMSLPLPANFTVTAQGLSLYYNAYEIASYATGPSEVLIPFSALESVVDLTKIQ